MASPTIAIVNYQAGNLRSVQKALEKFGATAKISSNPREIDGADGLVFPGQGANDSSMRALRERGLVEPIQRYIRRGKPFLGVCLGLQLLLEASDEGIEPGLGVMKGRTRRLPEGRKIPHMGWNQVKFSNSHCVLGQTTVDRHPVLDGLKSGSFFYFVHSYYADPEERALVIGTTTYGLDFCSAVGWDNVTAVQFHPEKSGRNGLKVYENFVKLVTVV
jgi:glutamine amidotransferase